MRVALALQALDSELLEANQCYFGGGTAIALTHGEYRESVDIDLLVSEQKGYRELRQRLTSGNGLSPILRAGHTLQVARDVRADQYGIRTLIAIGGAQIKFEIVFESRISLETPSSADQVCGVSTLTRVDMAATKLLANSDRWADDSVFSRDLIDLGMMDASKAQRCAALAKARDAYADAVERDLLKAISRLRERRGRLEECMSALRFDALSKAELWNRIRRWKPAV
jgi:hypothetical protein